MEQLSFKEVCLQTVLLLAVAVPAVVGLSTGAPEAACSIITPGHGGRGSNNPLPFTVDISSLDGGYAPGQNYIIILSGSSSNPNFRGFLIQGRVVADGTTAAGTFVVNENNQRTACSNAAATHTSCVQKTTVQLMWTAPPVGTGTILFRYAFVDSFSVYWPNQATSTVNEVLVVEFTSREFTGSESSGFIEVIVRITGGTSTTPITVTITPSVQSPVSAMGSGVDFNSNSFTIIINAGAIDGRANISVVCDDEVEGMETFDMRLTLTSIISGVTLGRDTSVGQIVDSTVEVSFSQSSYGVMEDGGSVTLVIALSQTSAMPFQVTVTTMDVTAVGREDYNGNPIAVNVPAGVMMQAFMVNIINNNIVECIDRFNVRIISVTTCGVAIGNDNMSEVIITDDDRTMVALSQSQYSVAESDTSLSVIIMLSSRVSEDVMVEVTLSDGSANAGIDYAMSTALVSNVTISAGSLTSSLDVDIINDMIQEDNETFNIAIRLLPSCLSLSLGTSSSTVTIIDNDVAVITFTSSTFSGTESSGVISATVIILGGIVSNRDISVPIIFTEGNATGNDVDFNSTTQNVIITAGTTSSTVNITVVDDDTVEGDETFIMNLNVPVSPGIIAGVVTMATATITVTSTIRVRFTQSRFTGSETMGFVIVNLELTGGTSASQFSVTVTPSEQTPVSAQGGVDFNTASLTATFAGGMTVANVSVPVVNDNVAEGNEEFILMLTVPSSLSPGISGGGRNTAVAVITDSTNVTVRFANTTGRVSEGDGTVTITIQKVGDADIPVTVTVTTSVGTATAGSDYGTNGNPIPPVITPITIPAGESSVDITVPILDDDCRERDETFNGELSVIADQPRVILGTTVITIVDDDMSTIEFYNAPYTVMENGGAYNVCLSITPACAVGAVVMIGTSPRDALPGSDYYAVTMTVTFAPNQMVSCVDMNNIIYDSINEPTECFQLVIMVPPSSRLVPGDNANVTILDDDDDGPVVFFNDTVNSLYEVPMNMISNETFPEVTSLCYVIHGEAGQVFNLISDGCVQVNANYSAMNIPENGNIISQIGVLAYDTADGCAFIMVDVNDCIPVVNGVPYGDPAAGYDMNGVTARRRNGRARITVPNCGGEADDLVFWVVCREIMGQRMIKFQVLRGSGLEPDSHGLIGQFWNIPVTATGPIIPPPNNITNAYRVRVEPRLIPPRSFVAELFQRTWDRTLKPCLYAGNSQGGPIFEVANDASVIQGEYFEYEVADGIFGTSFTYNRLQGRPCPR